jgi:uncharacterized protein (TIGR02145 family)
MKHLLKSDGLFLLILSISFVYSCKKDKPSPPVLATTVVTEVTYTTAVSGGSITNDGGASVISKGICWNTSDNPTISNNKTTDGAGLDAFTSNITQLAPNTLYYVKAYATNSGGTGYGNQQTFTTSQIAVPVLTTSDITTITQTTATAGGNITDEKGGSVTTRGVCWSISENPTITDNKTSDGSGTGSFTSSITGLSGNTKYYIRAYATNSAGTQYGNQLSFTTNPLPPIVTTSTISAIKITSAKSGGSVTNNGGAVITEYGLVWSTSLNPTTADNQDAIGGAITGTYSCNMEFLTQNTTYHVRAYATNSAGTSYGADLTFTTVPTIVNDVEGNKYNVVVIGDQIWLKENLKVTKLNDGTSITTNLTDSEWGNITAPAYCWPNNSSGYKDVYGALYNWYTINTGKLCPEGWHVPNNDEFFTLMRYVGGTQTGGDKLKESGTTHWGSSNTGATNETGFTALPAGERQIGGYFVGPGGFGLWWTSTEFDNSNGMMWNIYSDEPVVSLGANYKPSGSSVRCIKN